MQYSRHSVIAAAAFTAALSLAGCGDRATDDVASGGSTTRQRSAESSARDKVAAVGSAAKQKAGESADATRSAAPDANTNVMGAAREARQQAYGTDPSTTPSAGGKADDSKITSMVLKGFKADKELNPLRIDVDSREGVVTLSGSVPTAAARARAGEIARNVKDVRSVNDQLTVNAS
jgi:hyperosmotically inducible protein